MEVLNNATRLNCATCLGILNLLALNMACHAGEPSTSSLKPPLSVSFTNDIAPIFAAKCLVCHGPEKSKGGYRLDSFERLLRPGESKAAPVSAREPTLSELYRRVATSDPDDRMPQKDDPLPPAQVALIARWITEGARFDGADLQATLTSQLPSRPQPDPPAVYRRPVPVQALAFAPTGNEIAAGGFHEITIWNSSDGRLLRRIQNVAERTHGLAYNAGGTLLAAASGTPGRMGEVKLFEPFNGATLNTLATLADVALDVKFSPDGKQLVAGGADSAIRIFEVAAGRETRRIEQHADWVMAIAFNHDGTQVASASRDKTARIFNSQTGELESTYIGHTAPVFTVVFGADGKLVYSAGRDKKIHVWEAKDAKKAGEIAGFDDDIFRLAIADNQIFSCAADGKLRLHSTDKRELVRKFEGSSDWLISLAVDANVTHLAAGSQNGEVLIWDVDNSTPWRRFTAAPGIARDTLSQKSE